MKMFKVRFTKDFTLDVRAESIVDAMRAGEAACSGDYADDMSGDAEWVAEVWAAPEWAQVRRPNAVVVGDKLVSPDVLEGNE